MVQDKLAAHAIIHRYPLIIYETIDFKTEGENENGKT